jgi:hypothetical protein
MASAAQCISLAASGDMDVPIVLHGVRGCGMTKMVQRIHSRIWLRDDGSGLQVSENVIFARKLKPSYGNGTGSAAKKRRPMRALRIWG